MNTIVGYAYGRRPTYTEADIACESEAARIWEELNAPNPNESKYKAAASSLKRAIELLDKVLDQLAQGEDEADGLPLSNKIAFFLRDFEDRQCDLRRMMEKAERSEED